MDSLSQIEGQKYEKLQRKEDYHGECILEKLSTLMTNLTILKSPQIKVIFRVQMFS